MDSNRGLLVVVVLLVVLGAALGVLAYNQSNEIGSLTDERSTLESEKAGLIEEKATLLKKVSGLEAEIAETRAQIETLKQQLKAMESDNLQLNDDLKNKDETIASLRSEMKDARQKISDLNEQIKGYLEQIAALSQPIDQSHLNSSLLARLDCKQCHAVAARAVKNESNRYHNIHLNNPLLNFQCSDCHRSVDVSSASENLTRLVDIETCKKCHTTFPVKTWMGRTSKPEDFATLFPNCVDCHKDWKEKMEKEAPYVALENVTPKDCTTCHLDNPLFPTEKKAVEINCRFCH